jgi:hypothetical protein
VRHWVVRFGVPDDIDCGLQFTSSVWRELAALS